MKYVMIFWILHVGAAEAVTSTPIEVPDLKTCIEKVQEMEALDPKEYNAVALGIQCYKGVKPKKPGEQGA